MDTNGEEERVPPFPERALNALKSPLIEKEKSEALHKARLNADISQWTVSYLHYCDYFQRISDRDEVNLNILLDFLQVINKIKEMYETVDDEEEFIKALLYVLNLFPENVILLNDMAVFMFKRGEFEIARTYFDKALAVSTEIPYLQPEKNSLHLTWHQVPRWHFRMLNDTVRNMLFKRAIDRAINQGYKNVLDIGAGCGLLSLIAASNNDKDVKVRAFEENKTLANISIDTIRDNKLESKIFVHKIHSNQYNCKKLGNLIVAEIFDVALFGEHALTSLFQAVDQFVGDEFKIIPANACLYVTGIESEKLTNKIRFKNKFEHEFQFLLKDLCITAIDIDTYDAEVLTKDNCKFITKTVMFDYVDFHDISDLHQRLNDEERLLDWHLEVLEDGLIDALAVWFELSLDEEEELTTNPMESEIKCWEQAIFYLKHPVALRKGDLLIVQPSLKNNELSFIVKNAQNPCRNCFSVSREIITFLNDDKLIDYIVDTTETLISCGQYENCTVVDYHCFPLLGLIMYSHGSDVIHLVRDRDDLKLINFILHTLEPLDLKLVKFKSCHEDSIEDYLKILNKIDLVFLDCINVDGSWFRQGLSEELIERFRPRVLPERMVLKVQLIKSEYIDFCNKVNDENCFNFGIAKHINKFTGTEHPNLEEFSYIPRSTIATFDLTHLSLDLLTEPVEIQNEGETNAILFWFEYKLLREQEIPFSTMKSSHYCRACVILPTPKQVQIEDKVLIHIQRDETYLKIYCD